MILPALQAIRTYVEANYSALPMRWPNENWPADNNPQTNGVAFIEVEIIGGKERLVGFSTPGSRLYIHPGLIRFYICVPTGEGMNDAYTAADALAAFMTNVEFGRDESTGRTVRTKEFSAFDGAADHESGNFAVLMASCYFDFYYHN